jgi:hypothetical protein
MDKRCQDFSFFNFHSYHFFGINIETYYRLLKLTGGSVFLRYHNARVCLCSNFAEI